MSSVLPSNYLTPTGREEAWRFTPLKRIAGLHDPAVRVTDRISIELFGSAKAGFNISTVKASELPAKSETTDAIVKRLRSEVTEVLHLKIDNEAVINEP
ncbi:MAG: Fe-S cluster assembly protein SufD, partial [Actinomycetota bacterium]